MATLVTFRIAGWPAQAALDELGARVFAIARTIPGLDAVRISVGFFTTDDELERFAEGVELLAAHTPETIPPRRTLTMLGERDDAAIRRRSPPRRSWAEVRWRQFRNAPRPVVRAVAASLSVAVVLAVAYLAYDVALSRGADLPGGDLRTLARRAVRRPRARHRQRRDVPRRPAADRLGDGRPAQRLERGARVLRRRADRLPRDGRRGPGGPAAARLRSARSAGLQEVCSNAPLLDASCKHG